MKGQEKNFVDTNNKLKINEKKNFFLSSHRLILGNDIKKIFANPTRAIYRARRHRVRFFARADFSEIKTDEIVIKNKIWRQKKLSKSRLLRVKAI